MRILNTSSQDEMIAIFLKGELGFNRVTDNRARVMDLEAIDPKIITEPNINSKQENQQRSELFQRFRGWPDTKLFSYFPTNLQWSWVEFGLDELLDAKFINYSYWVELSDGTRRVKDASRNVLADKIVFNVSNDHFFQVAKAVKLKAPITPLIFVAESSQGQKYILEGHVRSVGYALAKSSSPIVLLLGIGEGIEKWAKVDRS